MSQGLQQKKIQLVELYYPNKMKKPIIIEQERFQKEDKLTSQASLQVQSYQRRIRVC